MPIADGYSFGSNPWEQFKFEYDPNKPNPWYNLAFSTIPWVKSQLDYGASLEPTRQATISNLLRDQGQGGRQARVDRFRRMAERRRKQGAAGALQQLRAQGLGGSGLEAGLSLDALNRAASETADYQSQVEDPNQILGAIMQIIGAGQSSTALPLTQNLYGSAVGMQQLRDQGEMQRHQMNQGKGIGGALGSLLGTIVGGGGLGSLGSIFGRGGGSQPNPYPLSTVPGYFGYGG